MADSRMDILWTRDQGVQLKPLDLRKCLDDTPEFRSEVQQHEEVITAMEKQYQHILTLLKEKEAIMQRDKAVTEQLLKEFEFLATKQLDKDSEEINAVQVIVTCMRQTADHQERMVEQIRKGVMEPMQTLLDEDCVSLHRQGKEYWKSQAEVYSMVDKLCQCKKHEIPIMGEHAVHLFDARHHYHKAACQYAASLNTMQIQKGTEVLEKLATYVMSEYSYFHVGKITLQEVQPSVDSLYHTVEAQRQQMKTDQVRVREQLQRFVNEATINHSRDLVAFHTYDLHQPADTAITNVGQHLKKKYQDLSFDTQSLLPPVSAKNEICVEKRGYLLMGELKTLALSFSWARMFFSIKNDLFVCQDPAGKRKHPIVLNLSLCTVKEYIHPNLDRNFCFKVISPARTLLLQAESSQSVQSWVASLTEAISNSLGVTQHPTANTGSATRSSAGGEGTDDTDSPATLPTGRRKPPPKPGQPSNTSVVKELYAMPGNNLCADCGTGKPKWASISLGVLICIECSGAHRSLGVSISKVRSLTLDTLSDEAVRSLKEVGNVRSNQIYEASLPEDFDKDTVRDPSQRHQFIKDKYLDLRYTTDGDRTRIKDERARQLRAVLGEGAELQRSTSAPVDKPSKPLVDSEEEEDEIIISASSSTGKGRQKQKKGK